MSAGAPPDEGQHGWRDVRVSVAGLGLSGMCAAQVLVELGARVTVVDAREGASEAARAEELAAQGVDVRLGSAAARLLPPDTALVVTSPGWRPDAPLLVAAAAAGVPVWGEVELAWRLRDPRVPWLAVTGTNGKTSTVQMLASILSAAGYRTVAAGNVGLPLLAAVRTDPAYDVIVAELSSYQLHWSASLRPYAAAVLNVAPDHIDWHGSLQAYAAAKVRIWQGAQYAVYNADDDGARQLAATAASGSAVAVTLHEPAKGQLGIRHGTLLDHAFADGEVLGEVSDVQPPAPHNVANALAAAALGRALQASGRYSVPANAVRNGLRAWSPDAHRMTHVATVAGVEYVDDSKATNPHAAQASLQAFASVVWVAGGLAKGATFDELAQVAAPRLRAVVLLGSDRALIAQALQRHAPNVPVVEVSNVDTEAMNDVVGVAAGLARPGDTVLLAPACASMDMFANYGQRGDFFAAAVRRLAARQHGS